jgi:hypothetical protein
MLRIPHFLENRVTDGRNVFSLTHQPRSAHYVTNFSYRLSKPQGHSAAERITFNINTYIFVICALVNLYIKLSRVCVCLLRLLAVYRIVYFRKYRFVLLGQAYAVTPPPNYSVITRVSFLVMTIQEPT